MSNYPKFKEIYERIPAKEKYLYQHEDGSMDAYAVKEFCINYTRENYLGKSEPEFIENWEDNGSALIDNVQCICGNTIELDQIFRTGQTLSCPKCSRKYKFTWQGMGIKEVEK